LPDKETTVKTENLPLAFEVNQGQADASVRFLSRGSGYTMFLTSNQAILALGRHQETTDTEINKNKSDSIGLRLNLMGANVAPQISGLDELLGKSNYFIGNDPKQWRTNVRTYAGVKYQNVYTGIDLIYHGNQGQLEYDFVVASGADPKMIKLDIRNADLRGPPVNQRFSNDTALRVNSRGELVLTVAGGQVHFHRPVVYQIAHAAAKTYVDAHYVLASDHSVSFAVANYDPSQPLVIDPVLSYSTYLGAESLDTGNAVAVDSTGSVYVTGETASLNFPTTIGAYQASNAGASDVFVSKIDSSGANLVYSTYLGGSLSERGNSIAVDSAGNAYVTGRTNSIDFPTMNPWQDQLFGDFDAFVTELNAQGNGLIFSTYLGGAGNDEGSGVAVDSSGKIYVTGGASMTSGDDFPTTSGAYQRLFGGGMNDAFVTKFDPTQSGSAILVYSTFLGGSDMDRGNSIAVDSNGNAYITGRTRSTDFPQRNPLQATYGGGDYDVFVSKLNSTATDLVYATYIGGSGTDQGYGIAVDSAGNAYVTGQSASVDFPTTANAFQPTSAGSSNAFVAKIDSTGSSLIYSTYFGGSGTDLASGIATDTSGIAYITGRTSTTSGFPTTPDAIQPNFGGGPNDAFVAKIDPSQSGAASLIYSSYLGGSGDENIPSAGPAGNPSGGIAVDSAGSIYVTGNTSSANFPSVNPYQATYGGGPSDAFIARITNATTPDYTVSSTPASFTVIPGGTASYTVTVAPVGGFTGTVDLSASGQPANTMVSFVPPSVVITDATPQTSTMSVQTSMSTPLGSSLLTVTGTSGTSQHATQVTLSVTGGMNTADLSLSMGAWPSPVAVQTNLTYRVRITNLGPAMATGVQVTDTLPVAIRVSATSTQGTCSGTSAVTCSIGDLDVGSLVTVTIVVSPQVIGSISNTATVTSNQPDPTSNDNTATVVTSVVQVGGAPVDVLEHHLHPTRDGLYIDPLITQDAAITTHRDLSFNASLNGPVHAQPLYVNNGPNGAAAFIVATEHNDVVALDAADGNQIWLKNLGTPVPRAELPCGDIDPLGITGTPVIDPAARVIFLDAMTMPDGGVTKQHFIYALSLDDGSVIPGWPVDVNTLSYNGLTFDSTVQNQRGALLLHSGVLYVPYGGHFGDCQSYHGWVVAVPETDPTSAVAWATEGVKAGIWAVGGLSTDGDSVFAATGNTSGSTEWMGGEAIIRLGLDDTFSRSPADFFTPSNWFTLDQSDLDLGGEAPLILDVPGATPSKLVVALGKSGVAHLLDRSNLGGIGTGDGENGEGLFSTRVAIDNPPGDPKRGRIRTAAATYTTASGTYVVFSVSTPGSVGFGCPATPGDLVALRIGASSPPTISVAWCANNNGTDAPIVGRGAPMVTTTDGSSQPVVWTIGAEGTNRLYAYNGETGDPLFAGGGANEQMSQVSRFQTPIAVNGRIIVAADDRLFVFSTQ
jgi:uncharacterized repeat protein (TIGR01451 family)